MQFSSSFILYYFPASSVKTLLGPLHRYNNAIVFFLVLWLLGLTDYLCNSKKEYTIVLK